MRTTIRAKQTLVSVLLILGAHFIFAQKYWVGGSGVWENSSSWSNSDGGKSGAAVPSKNDEVFFTTNSGLQEGDSIIVQNVAFAQNVNFQNQSTVHFYGDSTSNLLVTGEIQFGFNVQNNFNGYVVMVGSASDYRIKSFAPGEFKGIKNLQNVYGNKRKGQQTLAATSVTPTITDATCGCNGSISIVVNGGTGPFTYQWFPNVPPLNGDGTNTVIDLCPGKYNVIVTDQSDGVPFVESDIEVDGPSPLTINHLSTDSVNCNGGSDGSISTLVFGGNSPYTLEWDDPNSQSTTTAVNLAAGTYTLTVTDNTGCQATSPGYVVSEPPVLVATITDSTLVDCNGNCNGDATVTASGGSPSYTYSWYDAPGTPITTTASSLCEGVYNVQVEDSRGCRDTADVNITQPTTLSATISDSSNISCFGFDDGTAEVTASGGTPVYLYDWYNVPGNPTTNTVSNLAPGTYNVEITDDNGCLDTADVIITEPTLLTSSITDTVHVLCNGAATGEIEVTPVGGTPTYSYDWYDASGQTTARVTGILAGSYNVEVTDANGCLDTSSVTVLQPATALTTSITDTTHNLCFSDCDGIAIVTPVGGTTGYTFDWYDVPGGDTDSTAEDLCAGTYNVEVTDGNGCLDTSTVEITEPDELTGTTSLTMVGCNGDSDGEIDLSPTGGTLAYSFDWYDVPGTPTSEDVTGLAAGTYNVEITDGNGCLDTVTATITEPDPLVASIIDSTNILCNGETTGDATASRTGGSAPFTYTWYDAPGSPTGNVISNLAAGTYNVEVEDNNGCTDTADVIITEPATALSTSITDTIHITCKDLCIGEAEVTAVGGTGGYNYDWYDVPGTPTTLRVTGLCDGTYHVEVTDGNGCLDTSEVIITEPAAALSVSVNDSDNVSCNGQCDGKALVTYSGGTAGYTIDWFSAGNQATDTAYNLCPGTHSVQVTDANGCSATDDVDIEEPSPLVITINSATLPTCIHDCDGEMSVTASGSVAPYLYNWYDVPGTPTTPNAPNNCAGSYHVRVEDFNGCIDTALVILSDPDTLEHTIDSTANLLCNGVCEGYADITPIGGVPNYTVTWYDAPGTPTGTTRTDLCAGTWNFEILDDNGCRDTGTITLTQPALPLSSSITDTTHNVCFGACDGDATVTAAGGTGPYTYDWYNAPDLDTDTQAENLCAATYNVEVTDFNGCLDTSEVVITSPTDISFTTAVSNSACGGIDTSSASVSVSGGTPPYTYDWYDAGNVTNDTVTGLASGTYHCEITDANGCLDTAEVIIAPPTTLVASIRNDTIHNSCFGDCNGFAYLEIAGGTPNYTQVWYDVPGSPTSRSANNLCAGIYHVELTDDNGCVDTAEVEITEPSLLISSADSAEASCFGVCDGRVWTDYSGGVAPYNVDWYTLGNATTDTVDNVCTGTYYVEIEDANGCLDTSEVTVTAPVVVSTSITDTTHNLCFNDCNGIAIVTPSGGTIPYTYDWFNAPGGDTDSSAENLCSQDYSVEVTDANGCVDTASVTITSTSSEIVGVTDSILTSCVGTSDGSAFVVTTGGVMPYTYDWYNAGNQTNDTATGLAAGTYFVEITDALGCPDTSVAVVTEPDTLTAVISDTTFILCFGDSTGGAIVTPTGGTPGYTYDWYNSPSGATDSTVTGLYAGTFNVEVTDANGCLDTGVVTITQNSQLVLTTDSIEATCSGICTGSAMVDVTGGLAPYSYDWYNAGNQTTDSIATLCAGSYFVEVTDSLGCIDTATAVVTEPVTITANAVDSSAATCPESTDGWAVVSGTGGTLPYNYWWSDGLNQTTDTAFSLSGGIYQAAVTDVNGCTDTVNITVDAPSPIVPNDSLVTISCNGADDGSVTILSISGDNPGYTHSWSTGVTDSLIVNLAPGSYTDTITDNIGCVDTFTYVITEPDTLRASITDTTNVTCSYSTNGQAIVTPMGGTPVYLYDWYDVPGGDNDSVASGIPAGTYNVEVTDARGCLDTAQITITSPPAIVIQTDSVPSTCSGICDGIALVSVTGGTGSYTYDWYDNGNIDNDSIYNVCAGNYGIAVVDSIGCRDSAEVVVTQPVTVVASAVDSSEVSCFGGSDGWAVVAGSGGTAPYSYWWDDPLNQTNDTASGLAAGTYTVAVTDVNGCSDTIQVQVGTPSDWNHTKDSITTSCYQVCDGQITITPGGGTAPYTHSWSTGSTAATIIGLCPGVYADTITDANGCIDTVQTTVNEPDSLEAQPSIIQHVQCFGGSDGIATSTAIGGTSPYTYNWSDPISYVGDTISTASAGVLRIIVQDANGCEDTNSVTITEPPQLTSFISDTTHAVCVCNGDATVSVSGGVQPYTYQWNNLNSDTDSVATDLCVGDYEVVITDAQGCLDTSEVSIRDTALFSISITDTTHTSCFGVCDGGAIVTPALGVEPYSYAWTSSVNDTDSVVSGLCAGAVSVTVTDSIGCIRFATVTINEPNDLVGSPMFTAPLCNGDTNGVAWVDITGGTGPYTQSWDVASTNDTVYNVGIGTYTDTITDANGCMDTVQVVVTEPAVLIANLDSINVTCNGADDGIVLAAPTGGTTPYSYSWNDPSSATSDSVYNLAPGIYTGIVTDFNGCADTDSVTITEPPILASSITDTTHVACFCTGTASVTPTGGTVPYSYLWNDALMQTDSTSTGLCAGNYKVVISDANGCLDSSTVSIRDTSGFVTNIVDTSMVTCFGLCDGSALARAENGVQPYNFQWDDPTNTNDSSVVDLCAGNYSVTISDAIGCTHIHNITITQPNDITIAFNDTNILCNSACDGSIEAVINGGTTPYSMVWDVVGSPIDTNYLDSLCAGPVTIDVTDANGCLKSATDTIEEPAELIAFINPYSDVSCNGANDATLTGLATGGTAPYSYLWSSGETSATIINKGPGSYTVNITDTNNCVDDTAQAIIEPPVLSVTMTDSVDVVCGGDASGSATVTPTGGTAPYSYLWNDSNNQTDSTAVNLVAGNYTVVVTDANGCSDSATVTITEPLRFSVAITNSTSTSCTVCDGTAAVTPSGGIAPYVYDWYNSPTLSTDSTVSSLCASTYNVAVADANGCLDTTSVTITGPGGLTGVVSDSIPVSCTGLCDGLAVASGVAGTPPYTYSWDDPNLTANDSVQDLCAGTYNVVINDAAGCVATAQIVLSDPQLLVATITDTTFTGCAAPCSGDATVTGIGGNSPYSYSWNDFANQTSQQATGLCAGQYIATVTDSRGCVDSTTAIITGPNGLTFTVDSVVDVDCNGDCDGSVAVTSTGGVGGHTYSWNDPSASTDTVVANLCAGNYIGQVTDGNGCIAYVNVTVSEPSPVSVTITDSSNVVCNGGGDGWAFVTYSGGTAPYTVAWNDAASQTTDTVFNLVAGTYTVTVTDANGCSAQQSVTIEEPSTITASTSGVSHVSCTGFCIGQATLTVGGGTAGGGYTYLWENGETGPSANQLCSGWQTYTVTDGVGCTLVDSVEILDLNSFTADFSGNGVSCNGDCDGEVTVTPSGGSAPYTHQWQHGPTSDNLTGLCPGIYIDTVFDNNGCFLVDSFEVTEPTVFTVNITDSTNLKCFGVCGGSAVAVGNGGTTPYTYSWYNSPGSQTNDTATNLCASIYYVLSTDSNGCTDEDTVSLTQPASINVSANGIDSTSCAGLCDGSATVTANGGTGSLTLSWFDASALSSRNDLCAGSYTVLAIDDSSCVDSVQFNIEQPDSLFAIITDTSHIVCANVCDGEATVGQTGGSGPYTYNWYNAGGSTANNIVGQCAGTYNVEVTDANGCVDTGEVEINDINVLVANVDIVNISCNGLCDGLAIANPQGGVPPYTLTWNNASTADTLNGLCQGNYFLTVTDFDNCSAVGSGQVIEPAQLTSAIIDSANLDCYGVCDGYATVSPSGGTSPYTYQWNDPANQTAITATGLCAQNYKVIVSDARGCLDSSIAFIEQPDSLDLSIAVTQANCSNLADGSLDVTVSGGTGPYTYSWTGPNGFTSSSEDPTNLAIGTYVVTILDANGCSKVDSATVTEINVVNANAGSDTTICNSDSIQLMGSGGVLYSWSNGGSSATNVVSPQTTTEYILTVFNNGCSDTDSVVVNVNALPNITAIASDYLILEGTSAQLLATGAGTGGTYNWNPPIGLSDPTVPNPTVMIDEETSYIVTGTDVNGCVDTALITIDVASTIVFPDGITPNNDGLNDVWVIKLIEEFPDANVQIFNRWGEKVFESKGYLDKWDGTMNGKKLPVGTYYYLIDLGPKFEKFTGPITIMR